MSSTKPLRIVFAGTPDFAATVLAGLLEHSVQRDAMASHEIVAVYAQPDRPAGRGRKQQIGPVKQLAVDAGLPVYQPETLRQDAQQQQLAALQADIMVVVAYGLLLPLAILQTPRLGCINVHASLLPRWRGAAPIQRAIIEGDRQTGVTIMQMEQGLDTGPMLRKAETEISADDNAQTLHDRLALLGSEALLQTLDDIRQDRVVPVPQDDSAANYAAKLSKAEAAIDWTQPAQVLARQVRGFNPWPVAFCRLYGEPLRIWRASAQADSGAAKNRPQPGTVLSQAATGIRVATGDGVLCLHDIQLPGKRAMPVQDFINAHDIVGQVLA